MTLDKQKIKKSFEKAAASYDDAAVLQAEVGRRMLQRLQYMQLSPKRILDIGPATGQRTRDLMQHFPQAEVVALDLAFSMLQKTRKRVPWHQRWRRQLKLVCADVDQLPIATASCDMIFSNLTIQWCNDLPAVFQQFRRVLRPGGMLLYSTFGPDTLKELKASWAAVDASAHVSAFADMHDLGDWMVQAGLADPVMDSERLVLTYSQVKDLMRDLKAIGASNADSHRSRALMGKQTMMKMQQAYEQFRQQGKLPASYEVVYGHAWTAENRAERGAASISVPLHASVPSASKHERS